jgi:hypothetical protein
VILIDATMNIGAGAATSDEGIGCCKRSAVSFGEKQKRIAMYRIQLAV